MSVPGPRASVTRMIRTLLRWLLGLALVGAGTAHLGPARQDFRAQVPEWFPLPEDFTVLASGVVEILLGLALLLLARHRRLLGWVAAAFFVAVFPGNVAQYVEGVDAFGLDTDQGRLVRLFFQPVLVLWALAAGGIWPREGDTSRK